MMYHGQQCCLIAQHVHGNSNSVRGDGVVLQYEAKCSKLFNDGVGIWS
jgi:hypothetical protein